MPPSPPKRPSLARRLASLCPPPSFPERTGFPTSLADLVVRNHGLLRKPRKPRSAPAALAPPPCPVVAVDEVFVTPRPPAQPLSPVTAPRLPVGAAVFRLRPELLAVGGAVALALLAVWSEGTVAALTLAALSLLWTEAASWRRPPPAQPVALLDSCGRSPISPIREVEEVPRSSSSDSDKGSDPPSPRTAALRELASAGGSPKLKANKGSLRRMISKKLLKKPKSNVSSSSCDGEAERPEAAAVGDADPVPKTESSAGASESSSQWSSSSSLASESAVAVVDKRGPSDKFPLSAFVPVILAGLAAGKLPATALAVLGVVFSSAVRRL